MFFSHDDCAGFASRLARGVDGDVVVGIDSERFHVSALLPIVYAGMDIHRSGRKNKQADSPINYEGDGKAMRDLIAEAKP